MSKIAGFVLSLVAGSALALEDPPRTNSTTWEIYLIVLLVFVGGFVWVYLQQKKERERQERKQRSSSQP